MSYGDNLPPPNDPGPYGMPPGEPPPRQGMSTGAKVLLILGGVFGVMLLLCCGGGIWFYNRVSNSVTQKPQEVKAIQGQIVSIDVPPELQPQMGMDLSLGPVSVKMAIFAGESPGQAGMLMLMQMPQQASEAEMRAKMDESLQQQGKKNQIQVDARETRTITVDGQEVEFEFIQGTHAESGGKVRQVIGQFPGRGGTALVMYLVPEEEWDEKAVIEMLQSIKR